MGQQKVLLVEDDPDHRFITTAILEHSGFSVVAVADGEAAVRLALELRPDVVLMDVALPRLDGWRATQRIKAEVPDLCVVIVTSHASPDNRELAKAAGADRFVTKPIFPRELLRIVRECIAEQHKG